ncbi:MAG: hypothetical protein D6729_10540 [Deltaproteobacteria bacterium]|nr:MAG: hypothetical protein D6729_10540 [Deltaproteobacteria bacterium]
MAQHASNGGGFWLLENVSAHGYGGQVDALINFIHVFMAALFVGWGIYYVYTLFRFRAREGHSASPVPAKGKVNKYLEVGVVIIEAILLVGFSIPAWNEAKEDFPSPQEAQTVRVVAQQFAWNFHYPGKDGIFGPVGPQFVTPDNPLGIDRSDPAGKDDIHTVNELYLVKGKPVIARVTALDVIHSFGVPQMRVKQDAVPGMEVPIWFIPAAVNDVDPETGEKIPFEIACSQLCGLGHYRMGGRIYVLEEPEYEEWLDEQTKALGIDLEPAPDGAEAKPPKAEGAVPAEGTATGDATEEAGVEPAKAEEAEPSPTRGDAADQTQGDSE